MTDKETALAVVVRELPEPVARRGITEPQWLTLCNSLYPGANPKSVLMVLDYCAARGLDPMKKPCHIVPMEIKVGGQYEWRDVVMPGIYEYRTTAHRTGEYLGHAEPVYGPEKECVGITAPEWCDFTVFRWNPKAQRHVPFPVRTFFAEVVATKKDRDTKELRANGRWTRAPKQMLTKCAEAAGLREAFPEEIGGEPTAEEMEGRVIEAQAQPVVPSAFDRIPEALRDNLERAFTALKLSEAQRLVKLNEYLGGETTDPTEATEKLLGWCREQYKANKPSRSDKRKAPQAAATGPATASAVRPATAQTLAPPVASELVNKHEGSAQTLVGAGRPEAPPASEAMPKATEVRWGSGSGELF